MALSLGKRITGKKADGMLHRVGLCGGEGHQVGTYFGRIEGFITGEAFLISTSFEGSLLLDCSRF